MIRAVEICVTAHAPDERQAARASRFNAMILSQAITELDPAVSVRGRWSVK
jgi:hypothetical protein